MGFPVELTVSQGNIDSTHGVWALAQLLSVPSFTQYREVLTFPFSFKTAKEEESEDEKQSHRVKMCHVNPDKVCACLIHSAVPQSGALRL